MERRVSKTVRKLAVALTKGGTGKSTTAVNLGAGLARAGNRVLLVDTDTQGQDALMLGVRPKAGLALFVDGEATAKQAIVEARTNLFLLAGDHTLANLKRTVALREFGGEKVLSEALKPLEKDYDYIVIDTAPGWDPLTVNVLFYAAEILAPVSLEVLSLQGLVEFEERIKAIQVYNKSLVLRYVLPTFLDGRVRKSAEIFAQLRAHYPLQICEPIRYNVRVAEAPGFGQSISEFAPRSTGANDYQKLVERIQHGTKKNARCDE
jgi:chromosome partitioning protein